MTSAAFAADSAEPGPQAPRPQPLVSVYRPTAPVDVRRTLGSLRRGGGDPAWAFTPDGGIWQATRTPDGLATRHVHQRPDGIHVTAWGPGAERALAGTPDLLGARDDDSAFDSRLHRVVHEAHRRLPGLRVPRSNNVLEALVPAILEQKVVGLDAQASWRALVRQHGTPRARSGSGHAAGASRRDDLAHGPGVGLAPGGGGPATRGQRSCEQRRSRAGCRSRSTCP